MKAALSRVFGSPPSPVPLPFPETRIELPPSMDPRERYDFYLVLAPGERHDDRNRLMRRGIEKHFGVTIAHESRSTDVYVLTAPHGMSPAIRESERFGGGVGASSLSFALPDFGAGPPTPESFRARFPTSESLREAVSHAPIGGLSMSNGTMDEFCHMLEQALDRPVVDETGLTGQYDIRLPEAPPGAGDLFERLRAELGLVVTPGRRDVTMLVVRRS